MTLALLGLLLAQASDVITMSGEIEHSGSGPVLLELLDRSEGEPLLIWSGSVPGAGLFSVEIPAHLGAVTLRAASDTERDGVGPDDPQGLIESLEVAGQPIESLTLTLKPPERAHEAGASAKER